MNPLFHAMNQEHLRVITVVLQLPLPLLSLIPHMLYNQNLQTEVRQIANGYTMIFFTAM